MKKADYYMCPGCGEDVKVGSKGCPKCNNLDPWEKEGSEVYDGLDLPGSDKNHDVKTVNISPIWVITAILLLIAMLWLALG